MDIGKRLKDFRFKKHIKMPAIAAATGISKENLYKWEKGTKPSDFAQYSKLVEYLDKMENAPDYMLEDARMNSTSQEPASASTLTGIYLSQDEVSLPLAEKNGTPGSIITIKGKPVLIARRSDSSFIGEVDGLILVNNGSSMEPAYKSGTWIALRKLRFTKTIIAGQYYYIVDVNLQGIIRRIKPAAEANSIILISDNENDYPTMTMKMEEILALFKIETTVTKQ